MYVRGTEDDTSCRGVSLHWIRLAAKQRADRNKGRSDPLVSRTEEALRLGDILVTGRGRIRDGRIIGSGAQAAHAMQHIWPSAVTYMFSKMPKKLAKLRQVRYED